MPRVHGFFYPKTATGRSSIVPAPPWYYSGDLLTVEYRTDPARVAELLPPPLELANHDPGAVALIWAAHIAVDRALGYGLKYGAGFGLTHLGRIGGALTGS